MSNRKTIRVTSARKIIQSKSGAQSINVTHRSGETAISNGASSIAVTFTNNVPSTNYVVSGSMRNTSDASPGFYTWIVTAKAVSGFTVKLNFSVENSNYVFDWSVIGFNNG